MRITLLLYSFFPACGKTEIPLDRVVNFFIVACRKLDARLLFFLLPITSFYWGHPI